MKPMAEKPKSIVPNCRFGSTFLDITYRDRAVSDEFLTDKESGEIIYRSKDGKYLFYEKEMINPYEFWSQTKTRIQAYPNWLSPVEKGARYDSTYFTSFICSLLDWKAFNEPEVIEGEEEPKTGLMYGDRFLNPNIPIEFSVSQEANGFFVNIGLAPRDRAVVGVLSNRYNVEYIDYSGDDPEKLAKKELFKEFNFLESHFVLNYTVTWYNKDGEVRGMETADGYISANEQSLIPFKKSRVYTRNEVNSCKIRLNYIAAPKLVEGLALMSTEEELTLLDSIKDIGTVNDLHVNSMIVSYFFTNTDPDIKFADLDPYTAYVFAVGMRDYEQCLERAGNDSFGGVIFQPEEPTRDQWKKSNIWLEMIRSINLDGEISFVGNTTYQDLVDLVSGTRHITSAFSLDRDEHENFYVEKLSKSESVEGGEGNE